MGKYQEDARLLLEYVGGKENIAAVSHCVSRMRFVLNDPAKADVAKIEALKSAKGTFTQAGQFQVIIGNTVSDFYNDFIAVSGIDGVSKEAVKSAAKQNQNALQKVMSVLAEIFAPLIPAIITGGLILGFRNCIDSIYFFNNGTQTLCDISQFWSGVDSFLWLIGEAIFHMLPVCICWSVTKKMVDPKPGHRPRPDALVSGSRCSTLTPWLLLRRRTSQCTGFWLLHHQHDWLSGAGHSRHAGRIHAGLSRKILPQDRPAGHLIDRGAPSARWCCPSSSPTLSLAPSAGKIGTSFSDIVYAGIGSFRVVFGAIFSVLFMPRWCHHRPASHVQRHRYAGDRHFGGTMLWPMIALSNIAQGSRRAGYDHLQRKNAAQEVNVPSCISCYLGVTEPAMFGVNLKFHFRLSAA